MARRNPAFRNLGCHGDFRNLRGGPRQRDDLDDYFYGIAKNSGTEPAQQKKVRENRVIATWRIYKFLEINALQNALYGRLSRRRHSCTRRPTVASELQSDTVGVETFLRGGFS